MSDEPEEVKPLLGWQTVMPVDWVSTGGHCLSMFPDLRQGTHVRARHEGGEWFEGTIALLWFGVAESIDVIDAEGVRLTFYPGEGMGDEMQRRWPS
jgi:hypothetical protein